MNSPTAEGVISRGAVLWRQCGDEVLIRRRGEDELVVLAGTGLALWLSLDAPRPFADLVGELAEMYNTEPAAIAADVTDAVAALVDQRVVQRREAIR